MDNPGRTINLFNSWKIRTQTYYWINASISHLLPASLIFHYFCKHGRVNLLKEKFKLTLFGVLVNPVTYFFYVILREKISNRLIHPGEILRDRLLKPLNINFAELAKELKVSEKEIKLVCEGKANVTSDLAHRLSIYFDTSVELWLNLQGSYEKRLEKRKLRLLKKEIKPYVYKESRGNSRHRQSLSAKQANSVIPGGRKIIYE